MGILRGSQTEEVAWNPRILRYIMVRNGGAFGGEQERSKGRTWI